MKVNAHITIKPADPRKPAIRKFISELDEYQASLYPPESNHLEPVDRLISPNYFFIAAWQERELLGIASFRRSPEAYVEIKRLYVPHRHRGKGLAMMLMEALEEKAQEEGYAEARLETGVHQKEALMLYQKRGYQRTGPFGAYQEDPLSVFMHKRLTRTQRKSAS